ncbi:IS701 family transposase [Leucothrix pacifica]|uniref:IS701 family transposase n=1 Tax=Leucothrix pacifica TaxID=1247513 RepID=A0A317CFI3_9GAMM|nr:transposase [Leucothrix pacifica]PWQ96851.1 IS701 family transposase [Leucothrix pacifica]
MTKPDIFDLYTDYLITSFSYTTATGLSELVDGAVNHDQITRFLSQQDFTSKELWKVIKRTAREIEADDGVLIFDDTIQAKPHSKENELICWHFDHTVNRSVKGINLLNCLYYANETSLPVAFELVKKPIRFCDVKTQREKRMSEVTKNEQLRGMLKVCCQNQLKWRYALADSWFSSADNMKYIHQTLQKYFIFALKSNRLVALTSEDKAKGRFTRIDSIEWPEGPVQGWVKGLTFPVLFHRQIFTNKDGSTGTLYLISNELSATKTTLETIYQKRWKVEVFHKSIKSNTGMAKSPAKTVRTQSNHIFMSLYATARLEGLSMKQGLNKFAMKTRLYTKALQQAFKELKALRVSTA